MPMDREVRHLVQKDTTIYEGVEIPMFDVQGIEFACGDPRVLKANKLIGRYLGLKPGQLFPHKTPGALNNLIASHHEVQTRSHQAIQLVEKYGAKIIVLSPHTKCADDKEMNNGVVLSPEDDIALQHDKLKRAYLRLREYSNKYEKNLVIHSFILDIVDEHTLNIIKVDQVFADKSDIPYIESGELDPIATSTAA